MLNNRISKTLYLLLFFLICLSTVSCGPPDDDKLSVQQDRDETVTEIQTINLDNCGGKDAMPQTVERSQTSSITGEASLGVEIKLIDASLSAKYSQHDNATISQELIAPAGTNMEFELMWTVQTFVGRITSAGRSGSANYTYEVPLNLNVTSKDLGCPTSDFPGGTRQVYSADFSNWPSITTQYGSVGYEYGVYVMRPNSNTWIGPGKSMAITSLLGDFVFDVHFRIEKRNPSAAISLHIAGAGQSADALYVYFSVWDEDSITYSIEKGKLKDDFYFISESSIAEREQLPDDLKTHDWSDGSKITLKREGGVMQIFVNNGYVNSFPVSKFEVMRIGIGAALPSEIAFTSIEARIKP